MQDYNEDSGRKGKGGGYGGGGGGYGGGGGGYGGGGGGGGGYGGGQGGDMGEGGIVRKRLCRFCGDTEVVLDYKDTQLLRNFVTERGKLIPRRVNGTCAKHQRAVALAVRRGRMIALIPFAVTGK